MRKMKEQSLEIYQNLYRITEKNMEKNQMKMDFTEDAFLHGTKGKRGEADMLELAKLDNPSFIQSCYVSFFYRIPDEGAAKRWEREYGMNRVDFQKKVVKSLTNSQEFLDKKVVLKNNIYSDKHIVNYQIQVAELKENTSNKEEDVSKVNMIETSIMETNLGINRLYGYYKKLPKPMKTVIRRIAGLKD